VTNAIVRALEDGAGKLAKTLGEDAGKAVQDLYHDTGERLKRVASNHLENDAKHAAELERLAKRPRTEETPMYHVDDTGNITRLRLAPDGKTPDDRYLKERLTDEDKARLGLDDASVGAPKRGERPALLKDKSEGTTKPRPNTPSTEVPFGSDGLARATQLARHADKSYGTKRGDVFSSNNYAAAHVRGANGKGDFILVGRSHRPNGAGLTETTHSERMIGTPFLRQGDGERIQHLYTERAPCSSPPNCSSWMAERLPHVQVSHTVEYGDTPDSRAIGNKAMEDYLDALKASR